MSSLAAKMHELRSTSSRCGVTSKFVVLVEESLTDSVQVLANRKEYEKVVIACLNDGWISALQEKDRAPLRDKVLSARLSDLLGQKSAVEDPERFVVAVTSAAQNQREWLSPSCFEDFQHMAKGLPQATRLRD